MTKEDTTILVIGLMVGIGGTLLYQHMTADSSSEDGALMYSMKLAKAIKDGADQNLTAKQVYTNLQADEKKETSKTAGGTK